MSFYHLFYFFVIYSFIGWCMEVVYESYKQKKFVNRGFLNGPFCPIYGFGALFIILMTNPLYKYLPSNAVIQLIIILAYSSIIATILEYITGLLLEKFFKTTWWNYSNEKFNIKGLICLKFSIYWGIAALVLLDVIHPYISRFVSLIREPFSTYTLCFGLAYFIVDFSFTLHMLINFTSILDQINHISFELKEHMKTNLDDIQKEIHATNSNLIKMLPLSENIKNAITSIKVSTEFKKYTLLPKLNIHNEFIDNLKTLRRENILNKKNLQLQRQYLYKTILQRYSRLINAFPNLKITGHNKKDK